MFKKFDIKSFFFPKNDYSELKTLEERKKERSNLIKKRLMVIGFVIPFIVLIIVFLFKWNSNYKAALEKEREDPKELTDDVEIGKNNFSMWQAAAEEKMRKLSKSVEELDTDVELSFQELRGNVREDLSKTTNSINEEIKKLSKELKYQMQSIKDDNNQSIKSIKNSFEEKMSKLETKIKEVEENQKNIDVPQILNENMLALPNPEAVDDLKKDDKAGLPSIEESVDKDLRIVQKEVEVVISKADIGASKSDSQSDTDKENEEESKKVKLLPGLAKGTIITSVDAPTLASGNSEPQPIYISVDSELAIANTHEENIEECLIIGSTKGDFSTRRVQIRLSKLSCSMKDLDGNRYEFEQNVQGWVYAEDGKFGLDGRLITREGEIIATALPLTTLEALITALGNSNIFNKDLGVKDETATNVIDPSSMQSSMAAGGASGATNVLNKLSDVYLRYLESINPVIEIKTGRQVTIAFKGGEELEIKPYNEVNVDVMNNYSEYEKKDERELWYE